MNFNRLVRGQSWVTTIGASDHGVDCARSTRGYQAPVYELNIPPETQNEMNGWRENKIRAPRLPGAKMNGIWAAAPPSQQLCSNHITLLPAMRETKCFRGKLK